MGEAEDVSGIVSDCERLWALWLGLGLGFRLGLSDKKDTLDVEDELSGELIKSSSATIVLAASLAGTLDNICSKMSSF
jgi:hypothetical protein